jgi:hypothetical protein
MFVVVQHAPHAPGRFKRRLDAVQPIEDLEAAYDRAELLERMAHDAGRVNDTYRVYELVEVKP